MSSYARGNVRITIEKNKREIPMRASRGLKWENKMYKLRRSILTGHCPLFAALDRKVPRQMIFRLLGAGKIKFMRMPKHEILQSQYDYFVLDQLK